MAVVHVGFWEAMKVEHQVNELAAELGEMHLAASLQVDASAFGLITVLLTV